MTDACPQTFATSTLSFEALRVDRVGTPFAIPRRYNLFFNRSIFIDGGDLTDRIESFQPPLWIAPTEVIYQPPDQLEIVTTSGFSVTRTRYIAGAGSKLVDNTGTEIADYDLPAPFP